MLCVGDLLGYAAGGNIILDSRKKRFALANHNALALTQPHLLRAGMYSLELPGFEAEVPQLVHSTRKNGARIDSRSTLLLLLVATVAGWLLRV